VKGPGGSNTDWVIFGLLIKENPGSLLAVGVDLLGKILLSVVAAVSESGQNFLSVLPVRSEGPCFVVIDVDVELPGLRDIADEVKPGVIAVTPAQAGRNNVLLVIHHYGDSSVVIVRTDHLVIGKGKKD
jgi:hypothetical protein